MASVSQVVPPTTGTDDGRASRDPVVRLSLRASSATRVGADAIKHLSHRAAVTIAVILDDEFTIRVAREDGESLVLAGLTLARAFFEADPSARPGGYDALAGFGHRDRVGVEDVIAMNTTMRSRSKHAWWEPVFASDQRWLREIPADLDIVEADEDEWKAANGSALLSAAVAACIRPGIGLAGATKLLHLKRPRLVPILDRFVAETIGVSLPDSPTVEQRVAIGQRLATAIRREDAATSTPFGGSRASWSRTTSIAP